MAKIYVILCVITAFLSLAVLSHAQQAPQKYRLPDLRSFKHLTTSSSNHAPDIPGKQTSMDFYSGTGGQMVTVYSYRGRNVAFSIYTNSDMQNTYRIFLDLTGDGWFQEINRSVQWQLPAWVR
ncbi:MAG: hypothetical protein WBG50_14200 [Desulfomonilaceae bacterium]